MKRSLYLIQYNRLRLITQQRKLLFFYNFMVGLCGLEPQTSSLSVTRSNQLSYSPICKLLKNHSLSRNQILPPNAFALRSTTWWSIRDSNPGPPACKAGALANWANAPRKDNQYFTEICPSGQVVTSDFRPKICWCRNQNASQLWEAFRINSMVVQSTAVKGESKSHLDKRDYIVL